MRTPRLGGFAALLATLVAAASPTSAALFWNEATDGDLSGDALAPTPLNFAIGENRVSGRMGRDDAADPLDRDIFTFTLPPGQQLSSINVLAFSPPNNSFFAVAPGASISLTDPSGHLSNMLVRETGEILDDLAAGSYQGGTGLTAPLAPGTYTVWFQELSSLVNYQFAYTVVPEPGEVTLIVGVSLAALGAIHAVRRRTATAPRES